MTRRIFCSTIGTWSGPASLRDSCDEAFGASVSLGVVDGTASVVRVSRGSKTRVWVRLEKEGEVFVICSHLERDQRLGVLLGSLERGSLAEVRLIPVGLELAAFHGVLQRLRHLAQLEEGCGTVRVDGRQLRVADEGEITTTDERG